MPGKGDAGVGKIHRRGGGGVSQQSEKAERETVRERERERERGGGGREIAGWWWLQAAGDFLRPSNSGGERGNEGGRGEWER